MLIHEVAKSCDLTQKAVEYYVEQGLVCPCVLENGYRDFSKQDAERLKQIALYRKLGFSILEIKEVMASPEKLKSIFYQKTLAFEQEKVKQDILQRLCNGESLEELEPEINQINAKTIIRKKLMDLFPSYYGKFISLNFARYLTGKIETKEQMEAFQEIIDFFDNVPDMEIPKDLQEYLDTYLERYANEEIINNILQARDKNMENIDEFVRKNKEALDQYKEYRKTEEFQNSPANRVMELMKQICSTNGYYDKFIPAMRKLSPLYNEYYEQMQKANEQFIQNYPEYQVKEKKKGAN